MGSGQFLNVDQKSALTHNIWNHTLDYTTNEKHRKKLHIFYFIVMQN